MKKVQFSHLNLKLSKEVEHQAMVGLVVKEGWAVGKYLGMWAKLIKDSGVNEYQLRGMIHDAQKLKDYSPRGVVRNKLINKDF